MHFQMARFNAFIVEGTELSTQLVNAFLNGGFESLYNGGRATPPSWIMHISNGGVESLYSGGHRTLHPAG